MNTATTPTLSEKTGCNPVGILTWLFRRTKNAIPHVIETLAPEKKKLLQLESSDFLKHFLAKHIPESKWKRFMETIAIGDHPYHKNAHPIFETKAFSYSTGWAKWSSGNDKEKRARIIDQKYFEEWDTSSSLLLLNYFVNGRNLPWTDEVLGTGNYGIQLAEFYLHNRDIFPDITPEDIISIYTFNDARFWWRIANIITSFNP